MTRNCGNVRFVPQRAGMMTRLPIRDSVGIAFAFVRENLRFVLSVAATAALAQGAVLLFGAGAIWAIAVLGTMVAAYAALTAAALDVRSQTERRLVGDSLRVAAALGVVAVFLILMALGAMFFALMVLTAPYQDELKAAADNEAAVNEIMNRALTSQPEAMSWVAIVFLAVVFAVTTRFYLAVPATIERRRILVFESWRMTRGNFLRLAGARLLLLGPALIFVGALQSLVGMALGAPAGDPIALAAYSRSSPQGFAAFYTIGMFLQIAAYYALEAGLSSAAYRALKQPGP